MITQSKITQIIFPGSFALSMSYIRNRYIIRIFLAKLFLNVTKSLVSEVLRIPGYQVYQKYLNNITEILVERNGWMDCVYLDLQRRLMSQIRPLKKLEYLRD